MGVDRSFLKSKHLGIYVAPPLFPEAYPNTRWVLVKPLYGLPKARKERYLTLRDTLLGEFRREGNFVR